MNSIDKLQMMLNAGIEFDIGVRMFGKQKYIRCVLYTYCNNDPYYKTDSINKAIDKIFLEAVKYFPEKIGNAQVISNTSY